MDESEANDFYPASFGSTSSENSKLGAPYYMNYSEPVFKNRSMHVIEKANAYIKENEENINTISFSLLDSSYIPVNGIYRAEKLLSKRSNKFTKY